MARKGAGGWGGGGWGRTVGTRRAQRFADDATLHLVLHRQIAQHIDERLSQSARAHVGQEHTAAAVQRYGGTCMGMDLARTTAKSSRNVCGRVETALRSLAFRNPRRTLSVAWRRSSPCQTTARPWRNQKLPGGEALGPLCESVGCACTALPGMPWHRWPRRWPWPARRCTSSASSAA